MAFVTLAELKAHLNITTAVDDEEMADVLEAADDLVRSLAGPVLTAATVTETFLPRDGVVLLPSAPITSVASVIDRVGLPLSFRADIQAGMIYLTAPDWPVSVTYTTAPSISSARVRLTTLIIAAHLWETQRRPGFTSDAPAGFGGLDGIPDATSPTGMGFAIPSRAQQLLQPYVRPVIA